MSKRHNHAGREYVADRFIELKGQSSSNAFSRVRQSIETQTAQKDLDKLKDELDKISSDGVVTVAEKEALKREWASLQQTYSSINEQFSSDPELSENPSYQAMQKVYKTLSDLMAKILNDMTTDYVGEDAKELSTLFSAVYNYLTICQSTLNSRNEFLRTYSLVVTGGRAILDNTSLVAGIYKAGIEQQNPEFIDAKNYTWQRLDNPDGFTPMNGKQVVLDMDDLPISPCRFSVTWKDNTGEITDSLSVILTLTWGTIKEYAWSNAVSDEELQAMMPSAWSGTKPENPSNLKYLWRRESSDNRKTYQYFRETGEQGEQGEQGKPGDPGEPGEDAVFYNIWTDVEAIHSPKKGSAPTTKSFTSSGYKTVGNGAPENISSTLVVYGTSNDDLSDWEEGGTATDYSYKYSPAAHRVAYKIEMYVDDILVASKVLLYVYDGEQGEPGKPGEAPKYYYKYTKTDDPDAYKGGGILFAYGSKLLAVGSTLLSAGMAGWLDHVPEGIQYQDDFLWTKIVHADGTVDIIPPAQKGAPAKDIRIVASQESYQLTTRGIVKTDYEITFTLERNYINGAAHWDMSPPSGTKEMINGELIPVITGVQSEENPDVFTVTLKARSTIQSFTVSVTCEDAEITRSLKIMGVDGGEESPHYFKVYPLSSSDPVPTYNKSSGVINWNGADENLPDESPEGPLITGDYILHLFDVYENSEDTTPDREPIPFYYDKTSDTWKMLTTDSPYYSETMGTILGDVVAMPDMPVTTGALYGFFQNLAAQNAFITNLFSKNINFTGAIYSGAYDENGDNPTGGTGTYISAEGQLRAVDAYLNRVEAREAKIYGEFETKDNDGNIILKTSKETTSVSAYDSEARVFMRGSLTTPIGGLPSNAKYVKIPGYDQWFYANLPNFPIYDGNYFGKELESGFVPYLYDEDTEHDSKETFGKFIYAQDFNVNANAISLWTGDSDGSLVTATYEAGFLLGTSIASNEWASKAEMKVVLLTAKIARMTAIWSNLNSPAKLHVKVSQRYQAFAGISTIPGEIDIAEWDAWTTSTYDRYDHNYLEAREITIPEITLGMSLVSRHLIVTYTISTSISQAAVAAESIGTVLILPIEGLVPDSYNKALAPEEQYQNLMYNYAFVEANDEWEAGNKLFDLPQPTIVKDIAPSASEADSTYQGPTISAYDADKTLICTSSSQSGWLDGGGKLGVKYAQLYSQLSVLAANTAYDLAGGSYVLGLVGSTQVNKLVITEHSGYTEYKFYKSSDGALARSFIYDPDAAYTSTNFISGEYSISIASSLNGVTTASLYPAGSSANIGSSGNRYNAIYAKTMSVSGAISGSSITLSTTEPDVIPLPNGWQMEAYEQLAYDQNPISSGTAMWIHIDFLGVYASIPAVFVNYEKNDSERDDYNYGPIRNLSKTGCDINMYSTCNYHVMVIGKKG